MFYTVKIKRFWTERVKNVENDWTLFDFLKKAPKRVLMDKNKNTREVNLNDCILVFSKERPTQMKPSRVKFNAKYKKVGSFFWKTIKDCTIDTTMYEETETPIRVFITDTGERWEIPSLHYEFKFDKNKLLAIQDVMEQESGQKIDAIK
jgi:hypothetical protein